MALNIPMPESPGTSLLQGLDTGSSMMSRIMQPILEQARMKQQQDQFVQDYALRKQAQDKTNSLLPYMIQQYQDSHRAAASAEQMKELYRAAIQRAISAGGGSSSSPSLPSSPSSTPLPGMTPPAGGQAGSMPTQAGSPLTSATSPQSGGMPSNPAQGLPYNQQSSAVPQIASPTLSNQDVNQEREIRPGNPALVKLDALGGLVPGFQKPDQHIADGMIYTTYYPSKRVTVQKIPGFQSSGEKDVSAKEGSKIRDQATALVNSANLVQQGYDILDKNPNLTGPGAITSAIPIPFMGKLNLSDNPELGKFTTVTGKLQAELAKYASTKGGIQAIKWVGSVKPSPFNPQDYNYGMFDGLTRNLQDEYGTLNQQYKAATGQDLPVPLPTMKSNRVGKGVGAATPSTKGTGDGLVQPDFIFVKGKLVRAR